MKPELRIILATQNKKLIKTMQQACREWNNKKKGIERLKMLLQITQYEKFMFESNNIEGENRINPGDIRGVETALKGIKTIPNILKLHSLVGDYLQQPWVGKFRSVNVRVGNHPCPRWHKVPSLMNKYILELPWLDSWEAHNQFEKIHPFQDLNGRVGRLIWLSKAVKEGYDFKIPFLHQYYYQTLNRIK